MKFAIILTLVSIILILGCVESPPSNSTIQGENSNSQNKLALLGCEFPKTINNLSISRWNALGDINMSYISLHYNLPDSDGFKPPLVEIIWTKDPNLIKILKPIYENQTTCIIGSVTGFCSFGDRDSRSRFKELKNDITFDVAYLHSGVVQENMSQFLEPFVNILAKCNANY